MNLDFENALTYITKDPQWVNKFLAGSGLILAAMCVFVFPIGAVITGSVKFFGILFVLSTVLSIVIWLAISGYICETAYNRINNRECVDLPDWRNFGNFIILGMKYFLGYFLYFVPVMVVALIFFGLCILIGNPFTGFGQISGFSYGILVFVGAVLLFLYILTLIFLPLVMSGFFEDKKILSFVCFKKAASLVRGNVSNYVMLIILFVALSVLISIITSILCATIVGYILFPFVYMYSYLVISELCAQFVVSAKAHETLEKDSSC